MKLRFLDGYEFTADTKQAACEALWRSMRFQLYGSLDEWMTGNARAMQNAVGRKLSTDTPEHPFDDMIEHGILTEIP